LDENAVSGNSQRLKVVADRRVQVSLSVDRATSMADDADVCVALRIVAIWRAHESMRLVNCEHNVSVLECDTERGHKRVLNGVHDRDLLRIGVSLADLDKYAGHDDSVALTSQVTGDRGTGEAPPAGVRVDR